MKLIAEIVLTVVFTVISLFLIKWMHVSPTIAAITLSCLAIVDVNLNFKE